MGAGKHMVGFLRRSLKEPIEHLDIRSPTEGWSTCRVGGGKTKLWSLRSPLAVNAIALGTMRGCLASCMVLACLDRAGF